MIRVLEYVAGEGDYRIDARVALCGRDVTVTVGGGTRPHVGAVGVAISQPSLKDPSRHSVTSSVISVPGHKEDEIVRSAALQLSRALDATVVVSAGLHVDDATPVEIQTLVANFNHLIDLIQADLTGVR
jgi:hypothetical protein